MYGEWRLCSTLYLSVQWGEGVGGSLAWLSARFIGRCRAPSTHYVGCWVFVLNHCMFKSVAPKVAIHIFRCVKKQLFSLLMLQDSHWILNVSNEDCGQDIRIILKQTRRNRGVDTDWMKWLGLCCGRLWDRSYTCSFDKRRVFLENATLLYPIVYLYISRKFHPLQSYCTTPARREFIMASSAKVNAPYVNISRSWIHDTHILCL